MEKSPIQNTIHIHLPQNMLLLMEVIHFLNAILPVFRFTVYTPNSFEKEYHIYFSYFEDTWNIWKLFDSFQVPLHIPLLLNTLFFFDSLFVKKSKMWGYQLSWVLFCNTILTPSYKVSNNFQHYFPSIILWLKIW